MSKVLESNSFQKKKKKKRGGREGDAITISMVIFIILKYHNWNKKFASLAKQFLGSSSNKNLFFVFPFMAI